MARKKRTHEPEQSPQTAQGIYWLPSDAAWGGFVNIRLDDSQREAFGFWFGENASRVAQFLDEILGEGMKVGLSYDRENQCYIATFTGALVGNSNERYCATSRAGTLNECLGLAVWKHIFLTQGDYGNFRPANSTFMSWG